MDGRSQDTEHCYQVCFTDSISAWEKQRILACILGSRLAVLSCGTRERVMGVKIKESEFMVGLTTLTGGIESRRAHGFIIKEYLVCKPRLGRLSSVSIRD